MHVRVKKLMGNYGHVVNGFIVPMTYSSGAFEVSEEKGHELIARGIVEAVGAENAPAVTAPIPEPEKEEEEPEEMSLSELRKIARKMGIKGYSRLSKEELKVELEKAEEEANKPSFDATGGVA